MNWVSPLQNEPSVNPVGSTVTHRIYAKRPPPGRNKSIMTVLRRELAWAMREEGLSQVEIASVLGITRQAVWSYLQ